MTARLGRPRGRARVLYTRDHPPDLDSTCVLHARVNNLVLFGGTRARKEGFTACLYEKRNRSSA